MEEGHEKPQLIIRLAGALSFIFVSCTGLILNSLLVAVLYKGRKSFKLNAFFIITWQLIISDIITHTIEFIVPVPVTIAGYDIYNGNIIHLAPCFLETFAYCGTLFFSFLMTVNRITVLIFPRINQIFFQNYIYLTIVFVWLIDVTFCVSYNIFGCYKTFNSEAFHYQHNCPKEWDDTTRIGEALEMFFSFVSMYMPISMFIAYLIMIAVIKIKLNYEFLGYRLQKRKSITNSDSGSSTLKRELQLLAQGFLICGVLEIENIVFREIPRIKVNGQWIFLVDFIGSCISLLLCCIHPIVLFTFNREIQTRLKGIFKRSTVRIISTQSQISKF